MKITTRIVSGYALLISVLMGLAVYQVITIKRMQSLNQTLRETNFQNALACLEAMRDRDLVEEYTWKSLALADADYLSQLREFQKDYEERLMRLMSNAVSAEERTSVRRLARIWDSFTANLRTLQRNMPKAGDSLPKSLQDDLENLRIQTYSVYQSSLRSMSAEVEKSRVTSETAALILWASALIAVVISILVSFFIYRSISNPLARLTDGTRAIAEGKFFYRLDTSRNDEFSQLARDFNTMTRRLNELDEMKKDFVSHVSHELKAPLASMRETILLMLEQIPGPLTEKQKRLLELNLQSEYRLTSMISNLLDLSRIEAGVMVYELKSQNLIPIVQNAIAEIEVQANERQIQIKTSYPEKPLMLECDSGRIMQVVVNLINNAIKFSPRGGIVQVAVKATKEIPRTMPRSWRTLIVNSADEDFFGLVAVANSGPSIPDLEKEKIFKKFHQVKQDKRIAGQGVGLGLAISRTIVEAHRGAIWVEDNPGGGCRFLLFLQPGKIWENEQVLKASNVT
jgi:signal transduction histidine kinase